MRTCAFAVVFGVVALFASSVFAGNATLPPEQEISVDKVWSGPDQDMRYTATAGVLHVLSAEDAEEPAAFFYVSYFQDDNATAAGERPLTFAFNGGPITASMWLHYGTMGPKILALNDNGTLPPPPVKLRNNPDSWLEFTDMVFINPVGVAFSRAGGVAGQEKGGKSGGGAHWGVAEDVKSVGEFMQLYLSQNKLWNRPVFLVGESYGTTRAGALAEHLQMELGLNCNGVALISPVLDLESVDSPFLSYPLNLPTYAADAHYHGKLEGELEQALQLAEHFAANDMLRGLLAGNRLNPDEANQLYTRVAGFSGLDRELVARLRGRIPPHIFFKNLLADQGVIVGRMDGTMTGPDPEPASSAPVYDPSFEGLFGPFTTAANDYLRRELGFETGLAYEFLNEEAYSKWNWSSGFHKQGYVNTADDLARAMAVNPHMKVFVACGYYDMATPYFAAEYTVAQMGLSQEQLANIDFAYYKAGHMMYTHAVERQKLYQDAREFYLQAQ